MDDDWRNPNEIAGCALPPGEEVRRLSPMEPYEYIKRSRFDEMFLGGESDKLVDFWIGIGHSYRVARLLSIACGIGIASMREDHDRYIAECYGDIGVVTVKAFRKFVGPRRSRK